MYNALKLSTATQSIKVGPVVDATGAWVTTAVVTDFQIAKAGGALGVIHGTASFAYDAAGIYTIVLDDVDTNTAGRLVAACVKASTICPPARYQVVPGPIYDVLVSGTTTAGGPVLVGTETNQFKSDPSANVSVSDATKQSIARIVYGRHVIFVTADGNDANSGISPEDAKLTLQGARLIAADGDLIRLGTGTFADPPLNKKWYFAEDNIAIWGCGFATRIDGGTIQAKSQFDFRDCRVTLSDNTQGVAGLNIPSGHDEQNWWLENLFFDCGADGIYISGDSGGGSLTGLVMRNVVSCGPEYGINIVGLDVPNSFCIAENVMGISVGWTTCWSGALTIVQNCVVGRGLIGLADGCNPTAENGAIGLAIASPNTDVDGVVLLDGVAGISRADDACDLSVAGEFSQGIVCIENGYFASYGAASGPSRGQVGARDISGPDALPGKMTISNVMYDPAKAFGILVDHGVFVPSALALPDSPTVGSLEARVNSRSTFDPATQNVKATDTAGGALATSAAQTTILNAVENIPTAEEIREEIDTNSTQVGPGGAILEAIADLPTPATPPSVEQIRQELDTNSTQVGLGGAILEAIADLPAPATPPTAEEIREEIDANSTQLKTGGAILNAIAGITGNSITLLPVTAICGPLVGRLDIAWKQYAALSFAWPVLQNGEPLDLSAKGIEIRLSTPDAPTLVFARYATGGHGVTVSGTDNNLVVLSADATNTQAAMLCHYELWNTTDNLPLVEGIITLEPAAPPASA
jgi:hypothetical protein